MKLKNECLLLFIGLVLFFSVLAGVYQLLMVDLQVDSLVANLNGEKSRCLNVLNKNNDNLPDFINNERTSADKLSFSISPRCYKLINNFNVVKDLEIRYFMIGKIWTYIFLTLLAAGIVVIYGGINIKKEIDNNYEGNDDDHKSYY